MFSRWKNWHWCGFNAVSAILRSVRVMIKRLGLFSLDRKLEEQQKLLKVFLQANIMTILVPTWLKMRFISVMIKFLQSATCCLVVVPGHNNKWKLLTWQYLTWMGNYKSKRLWWHHSMWRKKIKSYLTRRIRIRTIDWTISVRKKFCII